MFHPTHFLVSRSRQTPVQIMPSAQGFKILTEPEWQRNSEPAFELRTKQGFFCKGISVVSYSLQPITSDLESESPVQPTASAPLA